MREVFLLILETKVNFGIAALILYKQYKCWNNGKSKENSCNYIRQFVSFVNKTTTHFK